MTALAVSRPAEMQQQLDALCAQRRERPAGYGMTTEKWCSVMTMCVPVYACIPTQRVRADWVREYLDSPSRQSYSGDQFGHIVVVDGRWLISDGHHRWAAHILRGKQLWAARVLVPQ